jgi:hypothetical protein
VRWHTEVAVTEQQTLMWWGALLRPLFPPHAELEPHTASGLLRFRWPPDRAVAIFIAPIAVKDYLAADNAVRLRSDQNLCAFVTENLALQAPGQQGEFRIVVASIDFVPLG